MRSTGRGTVGKLQNCLYVPEMNMNLISASQVIKQLKNLRFILDDGVCIIKDNTEQNADLVYENVNDLCEVTDLKWLGISDDSEEHMAKVACNNHNMKKAYIESVVHKVYIAEMTKVKREMASQDTSTATGVYHQGRGTGASSSPARKTAISTDGTHVIYTSA